MDWLQGEPTLDEALSDPVVQAIIIRDHVDTEGLRRFLAYARSREGVWFARRIDIARHWAKTHPHRRFERPSQMIAQSH